MTLKDIPNADLIRAVLDGQVVQVTPNDDGWTDMDPAVAVATLVRGAPGLKFRLKPRSLVHWLPVYRGKDGVGVGNVYLDRSRIPRELPAGPVVKVIRLELDAGTLEPLSVTAEPLEGDGNKAARPPMSVHERDAQAVQRVFDDLRAEA
ncbi:hypothetical protein [Ramlibacter humi]|uniref:Uncharacterized protein n=1 Tax=Ramlibacter humi TaxID=2530451 RepID=A0A4Z0CBC2_9BURK|nr:hypothetical protein [Ramlibacter humi]TFZ07660.1 hypothetical protein EZ216_00390 [Ramlibacter humi]